MMTPTPDSRHEAESTQTLPWYRYPWPWVAISIPGLAVVGGLFTLYLAITNPDPVILEEGRYEQLRAELQAQPEAGSQTPARDDERDHDEQDP